MYGYLEQHNSLLKKETIRSGNTSRISRIFALDLGVRKHDAFTGLNVYKVKKLREANN